MLQDKAGIKLCKNANMSNTKLETAVLGAGCFWCVEAIFQELPAVVSVVPGYSGGKTINPDYQTVSSGTSGHAEVAKIEFDSNKISYADILDVFWSTHDPTSLNRQGADVGTQYRSVIFFADEKQKEIATKSKMKMQESGRFAKPIVTEIRPLEVFYPAESYHRDYFRQNPNQAYCKAVIEPKVEKFKLQFKSMRKNS